MGGGSILLDRVGPFCLIVHTSGRNGTLYAGVTSNLLTRVWVHTQRLVDGFTTRYGVHA